MHGGFVAASADCLGGEAEYLGESPMGLETRACWGFLSRCASYLNSTNLLHPNEFPGLMSNTQVAGTSKLAVASEYNRPRADADLTRRIMEIHFKDKFDEWPYDSIFAACGEVSDTDIAASVAIIDDEGRRTQVNVLSGAGNPCFQDARCVGDIAYIGFGEYIFVLNMNTGTIVNHRLHGYFGHMYDDRDLDNLPARFSVLVTSASEALAFSKTGELLWASPNLGIDGVVFLAADERQFRGEGEWDPPGGWRKFGVLADSGAVI
jgi:hypothetical protein